jgi:uncharacterized membrane protein YfcA
VTAIELAAIFLVMTAGSCLHGSVGIGLGLLAAPLLVLIDPALVPGPMIVNGFVLVGAMVIRERTAVDMTEVKWALVGCVIGSAAAGALLVYVPAKAFSLLFGLMLLLAVGLSTMKWSGGPSNRLVFVAGAASGLMGTTTSIGGPPLALAYQNASGQRLRATLSVYFTFAALVSLAMLAIVGKLGRNELTLALYLFPGVVFGLLISNYTRRFFVPKYVRPAVLVLSAAAAVAVLADYFVSS